MSRRFFITGTDTGIGKTYVTSLLQQHFKAQNHSVLAIKPLASGCVVTASGLQNEDALILMQGNSVALPYERINPYGFEAPIAPHLAAERAGCRLQADDIVRQCELSLAPAAEVYLIEGVGGWQVPINDRETMVDVVSGLKAEVILVVGMRLGCLNHALLSAQAIQASGCTLAAWIANEVEADFPFFEENKQALQARIQAPLWGSVPFSGQYIQVREGMERHFSC